MLKDLQDFGHASLPRARVSVGTPIAGLGAEDIGATAFLHTLRDGGYYGKLRHELPNASSRG